jgi:hypothetical protein
VHPRTTTCPTAPDPASLLRRALALPRAPRLRTPHPCSGGLQFSHMSHGSGPRLPAQEGSGATTCRTALDPASLLGRAPVFPHVTRLWVLSPYSGGLRRYHVSHGSGPYLPAPGGSDAVTCPATLMRSHALKINKGLAVTACNKTRVFLRHACTLLRHLQDARADNIIMTCKPCGHALQYHATVQRRTIDYSRARLAEAMTRQDGATLQTTHHMARPIIPGIPTPLKTSLVFLAISVLLYRVLSAPGPHVGPRVSL